MPTGPFLVIASLHLSENVTCLACLDPVDRPSEFTFALEGKDFPALVLPFSMLFWLGVFLLLAHLLQLMNLPTPVEALKTFDNKVFLKSGDIGQVRCLLTMFIIDI